MESVKVTDHFLVNGLPVGHVLLLYSPNNPFITELVDNVTARIQIKHIGEYCLKSTWTDFYANFVIF